MCISSAFAFVITLKNGKSQLLLALVLCGHVDYHGYDIDRVSSWTKFTHSLALGLVDLPKVYKFATVIENA